MRGERGVFKFLTVGGVEIKLHWSWFLFLLFFTFILATGKFPTDMPGESANTYWVMGAIASLLFFISVLVHELAHSFMARALGYKVRDIILYIFGGASNIEEEPKKARDEFWIAVVGPLSSLILAGVFYALALAVTPQVRQAGALAATIFSFMALTNGLLGLLNMLPGFPLDGGRVLRSVIWGFTRDFRDATRKAGAVGQLVAYGLVAWGMYQIFANDDLIGGLWIAFIGWFLLNAAQQTVAGTQLRELVRGVTVGQVMQPAPPSATPQMSLGQLLNEFILPYNMRAITVLQEGKPVGIITLNDIKGISQEQWGTTTVAEAMTGPDKLRVASVYDPLERAIELLNDGEFDQIPVVDHAGQLTGLLTRANMLRWLQIRDEQKGRAIGAQR